VTDWNQIGTDCNWVEALVGEYCCYQVPFRGASTPTVPRLLEYIRSRLAAAGVDPDTREPPLTEAAVSAALEMVRSALKEIWREHESRLASGVGPLLPPTP
jgi:hypothetical protein